MAFPQQGQLQNCDNGNATFTYDAAGNRLSMADSNSTVAYQYDQLSRLTSETRTFNGLSGSFALSYEYTIGGPLKKINDLENQQQLIQVLDDEQIRYDLPSSVLGGAVILRLAAWQQTAGVAERNIYAGGQRIAKGRTYEHYNPVTGSWVTTNYNAAPWWNP